MGTVSKALSLIEFFNRDRPLIGLSDLTRLSGMNKATVHRLLTELTAQGYLEQVGSNREYRLGPVFLRLAALREAAVPTKELTSQVLRRLADVTGETAHMSRMQGQVLSTADYAYGPLNATRVMMEDAAIVPFHGTASGLAILAYAPKAFVDAVLSQDLPAHTDDTVTDALQLRQMFADTRTQGISTYVGGFEKDVHSHASPVFDAQKQVIGAVAVAAPSARMDAQKIALVRREVKRHALELTHVLGGFVPDDFDPSLPAAPSGEDGE